MSFEASLDNIGRPSLKNKFSDSRKVGVRAVSVLQSQIKFVYLSILL